MNNPATEAVNATLKLSSVAFACRVRVRVDLFFQEFVTRASLRAALPTVANHFPN